MITKLSINEWTTDRQQTTAQAIYDLLKMFGRVHTGCQVRPDPQDAMQAQVCIGKHWVQTLRFDSPLGAPVFCALFNQFYQMQSQRDAWEPFTLDEIEEMLR